MFTEAYRFAERTVRITSMYRQVHLLCADYRANDADVAFSVETTQDDVEYERVKIRQEDTFTGEPLRTYPDYYLETLAVYRKIAERMPMYDTFLMHGSCIAVDGQAFLFTAKSGTGKSTHTRLWRQLFSDRAVTVNDDKPLIRITDGGAIAYGTPWDGKHRLSCNIAVPLRGVCILTRAAQNSIHPIAIGEAYPMLLQQIYRPSDAEAMEKTMLLIDRMAQLTELWKLGCNMDPEAAKVASDAMLH